MTVAPLNDLLARPLSVLIAPDGFEPSSNDVERLRTWIDEGGVMVRFAGPALARKSAEGDALDPLLPVELRGGDRVIGGAMSWSQPMRLAPFPAASPFAGLTPPLMRRFVDRFLPSQHLIWRKKTWGRLRRRHTIGDGRQAWQRLGGLGSHGPHHRLV